MRPLPVRTRSFRFARIAVTIAATAGLLAADQILEVAAGSLTTYLAGRSNVQDARPRVEQRGVNLDGSPRRGSTHALSLAGNPFERAWRGEAELNGVRLDSGTWSPTVVDLSFPALVPWVVARSFNARQDDSGQYDSDGFCGRNWFGTWQPEIALYEDAQNHANDVLYLVYGADRYAEFQRTSSSADTYKGKNGAAGMFLRSDGSPDTWAYYGPDGTVTTFFGFDTSDADHAGQIWKVADAAGNTAFVGATSSASDAISAGFDSGGRILYAYDSSDRRLSFTYNGDATPHLTQVKVETKTGGTWSSPSGVTEVGKVDYTYFGDESHGDSGDLKTATVTLPLTDSGISDVLVTYYRYWEGSSDGVAAYNSTSNPGFPHALKLVLEPEGARKYDWTGDSTFDGDFTTETTDNLKPYAAAYFEYDSSHRVRSGWFNGQCGCSGAATGTLDFRYESNGSYSNDSGYDQEWARRTSVERPDGSWVTQYFDEVGQSLHRVVTDADPANTDPYPSKWVERVERDTTGCVTDVASPANLKTSTYSHSSGTIEGETSVGVIWRFSRQASGNKTGFVLGHKFRVGTTGTQYWISKLDWATLSKTIAGSNSVLRPRLSEQTDYQAASGTPPYDLEKKTISTTAASSPNTLSLAEESETAPAISTSNNGSGSGNPSSTHFALSGRVDFEKDEAGHITYREYTNSQLTKLIRDADTTSLSPPTGFSSSGTELHEVTEHAYDAQGRPTTTTLPGGRVTKRYYTKLADRRLVTIEFPKYEDLATDVYWGPARFFVTNHAGKVELEGVIKFSGGSTTSALTSFVDETDSDPITAIDVGTLAQMRTSIYDEAGTTLETARAYFSIPSSGAGTDGTHYDATTYGYDDMGRRRRVKKPHGTITRTVFDARGQVTARWIGTNDSSFPGGESGTDNMVKVEELVYDGGADDGNGLLTERTEFIEGSSSGERVTTYEYDDRGRAIVANHPTAPHTVTLYNNQGQVLAVGQYSSTSGLDATTDPTSTATNRLALSRTYCDELGRVWKTTRHQIDAADGSDDDNLEALTWYDAEGQVVKVDGEQLEKNSYDRLGRQTHRFVLADDNDTAYADVDDLTGDIVIEEHQTTFDTDGTAIMEARISRFHDDIGGSQTTGALDTNADSDVLAYTASNVEGRISITASWYDELGRVEDRVEFGTYGGSTFDRDGLSVPTRSDTALRSTYSYNDDGTLLQIEDPKALETRYEYDALGRRTKVIANYDDGTPGGTDGDEDQTVTYAFTDGLQVTITADLPSGETDQVTTYTYGTVKGTSAGDSKIATGHLLQKVQYPDSSGGSDVVTYAYNAQSQEMWRSDQSGNVIESDFDDAGRLTHRRVTTLASGFDGAVRRISTTYTSLGQTQLVTQYDNATVGSGSVVNEVKYTFDGWGNLTTFEQDRDSAVAGGGNDYEVSYAYAKATGGRNTLRRTSVTLPDSTTFNYAYLSTGNLLDAESSRVSQMQTSGGTPLVTYDYNGAGQVVRTYLEEPDVMWKLSGSSGSYPDLDRFDRVVASRWTADEATDRDFFSVALAYDRNSNITSQDDLVHTGHDAAYSNDDLNRLTRAQEGTWGGSSITTQYRDQQWTLNQTGNWEVDKVNLNGDADFTDAGELNDDRTHNAVNELTARDTDDNGTDDFSLTYDAAGNLTDDGEAYKFEWDAFYRLRKVKNQSDALVSEYWYNGLGYLLTRHQDTDRDGDVDSADKKFHTAYDERWRQVATYRGTDSSPKERFVYHCAGAGGFGGSSYIDLVVLRDRDYSSPWTSASDGNLETRTYYCQNWRADVVAIVDVDGWMVEWAKYSAYGIPFGIPGGDTDSDGDCDATDVSQVQTWINAASYDARGDIDLDGDVDASDKSAIESDYEGALTGRGLLTDTDNRKGYAGYEFDRYIGQKYHVRHRVLDGVLGRALQRESTALTLVQERRALCFASEDAANLAQSGGSRSTGQSTQGSGSSAQSSTVDPSTNEWHGGPFNRVEQKSWDDLNTAQKGLVALAALRGRVIGSVTGNSPGHDSTDASFMRHCVATCEMTKYIGGSWAETFMDAHETPIGERSDGDGSQPPDGHSSDSTAEMGRDLKANAEGRECGEGWSSLVDCVECCYFSMP